MKTNFGFLASAAVAGGSGPIRSSFTPRMNRSRTSPPALPLTVPPPSPTSLTRIIVLLAMTSFVSAEEEMRSGNPKDCYMYSYGKGPNWVAKVSVEFRLSLLNHQMPYVNERCFEPTGKALTWIERQKEPTVMTIATVEGRKVIRVEYPEKGSFGKTIGTVLLAIESTRDSEWFSPFFAAQPELFSGQFISGRDVAFGYNATLEWSGTGGLRTHYLFDLRQPHPRIVSTVSAGRVRRPDYATDAEYEQALKIFDQERDLLAGIIDATKPKELPK